MRTWPAYRSSQSRRANTIVKGTNLTAITDFWHDGQAYSKASDPNKDSKQWVSWTPSWIVFPFFPLSVAGAIKLTTSMLSTLYLTFLQSPHCRRCSIPYEKITVGSSWGTHERWTEGQTHENLTCIWSILVFVHIPAQGTDEVSEELFGVLLLHRGELWVALSNQGLETGRLDALLENRSRRGMS